MRLRPIGFFVLLALASGFPAAAGSWSRRGPDGIRAWPPAVDPSTPTRIAAISGRYLVRSTDEGRTWRKTAAPLPGFGPVAIDPFRSGTYLSPSYDEVLLSTDDGACWESRPRPVGGPTSFDSFVADPTRIDFLYLATAEDGIERSTDLGLTWQLVGGPLGPSGARRVLALPDGVVLAATGDSVFRSTDGATSFVPIWTGEVDDLDVDPADPSRIFIADSVAGTLSTSVDGGSSFSSISWAPPGFGTAISPGGGPIFRFSSYDGLFRSSDGGSSFAPVSTPNGRVIAVAVLPSGRVLASSDGGLLASNDGGATFAFTDAIATAQPAFAVAATSVGWLAGMWGRGLARSLDSGLSFLETPDGNPVPYAAGIHEATPGNLLVSGVPYSPSPAGLHRSTDGGASFTEVLSPSVVGWARVAVSPTNRSIVYAAGTLGRLYRSIDAGGSWSDLSSGSPSADIRSIAVGRTDADDLYLGTGDGTLHRSTDGGLTFTSASHPALGSQAITSILPLPGALLLGTSGDGAYRSTDGGVTLLRAGAGLFPLVAITAMAEVPDGSGRAILAARDNQNIYPVAWPVSGTGIFESADSGATWWNVGSIGGPADSPSSLDFDPVDTGILIAGTGSGIFRIDLGCRAGAPIASPVLSSPADGAGFLSRPVSLTWKPVSGAARYRVRFGTTSPPPVVAEADEWTTSFTATAFASGTFHWSIDAVPRNGGAPTASSEERTFATASAGLVLGTLSPSAIDRFAGPVDVDLSGAGFSPATSFRFGDCGDPTIGGVVPTSTGVRLSVDGSALPSARYDLSVREGADTAALPRALAVRAFVDVTENDWYFESSDRVVSAGLLPSFGSAAAPEFRPGVPLDRSDVAVSLVRAHFRGWGSIPSRTCAGLFADLPCSDPRADLVEWAVELDLAKGHADGLFHPENPVSRAEAAVFLARFDRGAATLLPAACTGFTWSDAAAIPAWARLGIDTLASDRIAAGCGAGAFCPNLGVTRADFATWLARTLELVPRP